MNTLKECVKCRFECKIMLERLRGGNINKFITYGNKRRNDLSSEPLDREFYS